MLMKSLPMSGALRLQRGVGLIEVLIAVLVLSVGLLGLASLQVRTLRNSQSALERGVAVVESHAIADAMRANRDRALSDDFDIALTDAAPTGATFAEVAVREWRANLIASLGQGATGSVACAVTACTIVIQWNDSRGTQTGDTQAGSATQQLITQVQL
jgi:type IV pilus assembly protein PilV